jgi:hypothetical protein
VLQITVYSGGGAEAQQEQRATSVCVACVARSVCVSCVARSVANLGWRGLPLSSLWRRHVHSPNGVVINSFGM